MGNDADPFRRRQARARELLAPLGLGGILFFDLKNIRYLTGFTGSDGILLLMADRSVLLVDGRYRTQAALQADSVDVHLYEEKAAGVLEALSGKDPLRLGFESLALSVDLYLSLVRDIGGDRLVPLRDEVRFLRSIKEDAEVALMREAAAIASKSVLALFGSVRPGVSERELALELEHLIRANGADGLSFPLIVASGENSALPHACPDSRRLQRGDVLIIDFGAVVAGYCSDETVTVVLGPVDPAKKQAHAVLRQALEEASRSLRPGVPCREVDQKARDRIAAEGWATNFSHGTGHGVGLDVHEAPRLSFRSDDVLRDGMVVTVEPGVYFPGQWGMRLEDMILVRSGGLETLSRVPKELTVL